jgi:hypothetical protein
LFLSIISYCNEAEHSKLEKINYDRHYYPTSITIYIGNRIG